MAWDIEQVFSCDETSCRTDCSWFGFKIAVKADAPLCRADLAEELDRNKLGNRMLFGGSLLSELLFSSCYRNDQKQSELLAR